MSEQQPSKSGGGLWARLFHLRDDEPAKAETVPTPEPPPPPAATDVPPAPEADGLCSAPVANGDSAPVETESPPPQVSAEPAGDEAVVAGTIPETALETETAPIEQATAPTEQADVPPTAEDEPAAEAESPAAVETVEAPPVELPPCSCCGSPRKAGLAYCDDCGFMFPALTTTTAQAGSAVSTSASTSRESAMAAQSQTRIKDRYELGAQLGERLGVRRFRGRDLTNNTPVVIVAAAAPDLAMPIADDEAPAAAFVEDDIMPGFDDEVPVAVITGEAGGLGWPAPAWEQVVLQKANHPSLPRVLELVSENGSDYLILEAPQGRSLWDAWDEPEADAAMRYGWLVQVAAALHALHQTGAILEGANPDMVVVDQTGLARLADVGDMLPLPLPPHPPLKATLYTAPELILEPHNADARASLYSVGAMLYSLEYLHHALEEKDFERQFVPRQVTDRYPDVHPLFLRLVNKTFVRDVNTRFPTDEAGRTDPTGFAELIKSLEICRKSFDTVRLDVAAWTTTGMVRTGNEDALAFLHGVEARQDDLYEYAMVLLCDGMGGYEAGEVAAALTISEMRKFLLQQPLFAALAGKEPPSGPVDVKAYQQVLLAALKHANREVYTAARTPGKGRRGMGCTAEAIYIDPHNVIVGHVGDSRCYHLHKGRLVQLTRDQTLVNRLVELGQLTAEEAENHPRKNELQQAIGGQPDVNPGLYHGKIQRGDWVLVCSDGLTNHISNQELEKMLTRETAGSAEEAARRLLNLVNLRGATDNATIVVVRAS